MIKEAINKIQEMALDSRTKMASMHGLDGIFSSSGFKYVRPPLPVTLRSKTLTALTAWFDCPDASPEGTNGLEYFISVPNHLTVDLVQKMDAYKQQADIMVCSFDEDNFPYDRYIPVEDFIIKIQTRFVETASKTALINMVSSIKGEEIKESMDNGIAQTVHVVDSIGRLEETETKPMLTLRPRRTFAEVEQPESPFLLRLKRQQGELYAALFEADCGAWKVQAIKNIVSYLRNEKVIVEEGITVIG